MKLIFHNIHGAQCTHSVFKFNVVRDVGTRSFSMQSLWNVRRVIKCCDLRYKQPIDDVVVVVGVGVCVCGFRLFVFKINIVGHNPRTGQEQYSTFLY